MQKYKKRADGRYCTQIQVGYHPNGKRKMKSIYGKTVREVEKKEREIREQLKGGIKVAESVTVGSWADIWLKTFKNNIANNTYTRYEGIINNQIKPNIGNMLLNNIRLDAIQHMFNGFKTTLSTATIKKIRDVMHQMFQQAIKSRYIAFNPMDGVEIQRVTQKNREVISEEHTEGIKEFCKTYEHGDLVMCLLYTGMRRGEILALTVDDINFKNHVIIVNKAVEYIKNSPNIKVPKTPKSKRTIPILDCLKPFLERAVKGKNGADVVFSNKDGLIYNKVAIQRLFTDFNAKYNEYIKAKAEKNGYSECDSVHFTMHQFRHTFCTLLYNAGIDVKMAQDILGHNSVNVTLDIYTHISNEHKKISVDRLNEYISGQSKVSQTIEQSI